MSTNTQNQIHKIIKILQKEMTAEATVAEITEFLEDHGYEVQHLCINCGAPATHGIEDDYPQCDEDYEEEQLQSSGRVTRFFEHLMGNEFEEIA